MSYPFISYPLFCWQRVPSLVWFRVCGYGICIQDTTRHRLTFSQRTLGHGLRLGKYILEVLEP